MASIQFCLSLPGLHFVVFASQCMSFFGSRPWSTVKYFCLILTCSSLFAASLNLGYTSDMQPVFNLAVKVAVKMAGCVPVDVSCNVVTDAL